MKIKIDTTNIHHLVLWFLILLLIVGSVAYFSVCYLSNGEIIFGERDKSNFFSFMLFISSLVALSMFISGKLAILKHKVFDVSEDLVDVENNLSGSQRDTQRVALCLFKRLGVGTFEKEQNFS